MLLHTIYNLVRFEFLRSGCRAKGSAHDSKMQLKGRVTVYSITGCHHCKAAMSKLAELDLSYTEVNLDENPEYRCDIMD